MNIVLVGIGKVDKEVLEFLKNNLGASFNKQIYIGSQMPEPDYAYNRKRNQYFSTAILNAIIQEKEYAAYERILGVVDRDLYIPQLNFVFGQAKANAAIISLTRLRQGFYGLEGDINLFYRRVLTEAVHELGHTYGLGHCSNPRCVMFFSNSLIDTDRKNAKFCSVCKRRLQRFFDNYSPKAD